ncbi:Na(+)-translocating NADH-quinone reductase subunit A [Marinovum sp.]|uniref:Na(+)-translocating NADH-quinone reductase subunit A n=1 Tax=Marinovum sp. TaxID=2024839 RepID=UPI003A91F520
MFQIKSPSQETGYCRGMFLFHPDPGLSPRVPSPPLSDASIETEVTAEAGITPGAGQTLRVTPLVDEGAILAQGAPVACLQQAPDVHFVAPMAGLVARLSMRPGRKLSEIVLFREALGDVVRHETAPAGTEAGLRRLMQRAGVWPCIQRRPFGGMPTPGERPAAIMVMAADTRPLAPVPRLALAHREEALDRGIAALTQLTDGPVLLCAEAGAPLISPKPGGRVQLVTCGGRHPQGSGGIRIHQTFPATHGAPVWEIHAEDVASLGDLLATGILPQSRLVSITGGALRQARLVHTQPGADLRELTQQHLRPGQHRLLSGSAIDGHRSHWLAPRARQVTALTERPAPAPRHWLLQALTRSAGPGPVIPTAALDQAFGGALPAVPFVRALSAGDTETATRMGLLSLLEDDVAMADYVLGGEAGLASLLRGMLDDIQREVAA